MAYAWPALISSDVLSGEGAETTGQGLFNQQNALKQIRRMTVTFVTENGTTTPYAPIALSVRRLYIPHYARDGETFCLFVRCRKQGGSTSIDVRFQIAATQSTTFNTTSTSYVSSTAMVLTIPGSSGWQGTIQDFEVQLQVNGGGSGDVKADNLMGNFYVDSA